MTEKEKIRAEIKRLYDIHLADWLKMNNMPDKIAADVTVSLLHFIDNLPEEPLDEDLEKEIDTYLSNHFSECSNGCLKNSKHIGAEGLMYSDLSTMARYFAKIGREYCKQD